MKPLLYKNEMASAPTQKNLSEGLSEGGEEDFWYNMFEKNKYQIVKLFVFI